MTGPEIGRGGWATVSVAHFKGAQVAVKRIHNQIVSRHNEDLFRRETQMVARLHHPNLVQFIGATLQGDMMILMELMPTSLRRQIEADGYITPKLVKHTSLDIVRALNYLHKMKADPISAHYYPASVSSIPITTDSIPAGDGSSAASSCSTQRITSSSCSVPGSTNSSCNSTAYISSADLRIGSVTSTNGSASSEAEHS